MEHPQASISRLQRLRPERDDGGAELGAPAVGRVQEQHRRDSEGRRVALDGLRGEIGAKWTTATLPVYGAGAVVVADSVLIRTLLMMTPSKMTLLIRTLLMRTLLMRMLLIRTRLMRTLLMRMLLMRTLLMRELLMRTLLTMTLLFTMRTFATFDSKRSAKAEQ